MNAKRNRDRSWTPAEEAELRVLYEGGMALDVISLRLNRSENGVRSRIDRAGIRRVNSRGKPWSAEEEAEFTRLWRENTPTKDLIEKLGRGPDAFFKKAKALGLGPREFSGKSRPAIENAPLIAREPADENVALRLRKLATARFLIDFKRAGYTAEHYRRHCEMPARVIAREPCLSINYVPRPAANDPASYLGSPGAMCAA